MKANVKYFLFGLFLALAFSGNASAKVQVFAAVDTSKDIYVGEAFTYQIIIDGDDKSGKIDLSPLEKFKPQYLGGQPVSQTSISIINSKQTTTVIKRYAANYSITIMEAGPVTLPQVKVEVDGTVYTTNEVKLNILKPGTTDKIDLEVSISEENCYVGQPVLMTINFFVSADIGEFQFDIPAFSNDAFDIDDPDLKGQERQFRLNNGMIIFVTQQRVTHKGKDSRVLSFSKVLIPKRPGLIEIQPTTVSADVSVGTSRSLDLSLFGRTEYKRFMVKAEGKKLNVLSLPQEGRPADFYGLIGRYSISALASPTKVYVGEPITLTIKIGGEFLKPVAWPALEQIPQMKDNFKIPSEKASPTVDTNGFKVFVQTIRAENDKITQIPPIPLSFFDPDKGKFVTAQSNPIKLEVSPTKVLTGSDMAGAGPGVVNKEVEAISKGLSANYENPDILISQQISLLSVLVSPGYAILWAGPFTVFLISSIIKILTQTSPEKIAARRRRTACSRASGQIKKVLSAGQQNPSDLLASAMKQYIGERFDRTAGSLTADDCRWIILGATSDSTIANAFSDLIAACEASRYGSMSISIDSAKIKEVIELLHKIDKKAGK